MTLAAAGGDNSRSLFATPAIVADRRADGSMVVRSTVPLQPGARCIGDWLEHWARQTPDTRRRFAYHIGGDYQMQELEDIYVLLKYKDIVNSFHKGLPQSLSHTSPNDVAAIQPLHSAAIISGSAGDTDAISFRSVAATPETADVGKALAAITPDTIAKFLFTSGSTGTPKAVINTQRMLTSSQRAKAQTWTFLEDIGEKLVILDWLPWSHTFGANHNFNLVLRNGGTLYVDGGKPAPGLFATSLANLRSVMPTVYFNVPRGFDMLIAALRSDEALRTKFFSEVKFAFYAGAALPQNLWDALEELSIKTIGRAMPIVSAWGSTETSPLATP